MMQPDGEKTFGAWLQRRRRGLGLTQHALAQQLGCAPITLRKIEAEERRPSLEIAQRLAECLRVPPPQHAAFLRFARGEMLTHFVLDTNPPLPSPPIHIHASHSSHSSSHPSNLPHSPYPIIGREALLAQAAEWVFVKHARVLTLIGPPGVGKTRLSLEVARALHEGFAHGVTLVELAPVQQPSLVPAAIAEALHIEDNNATSTAQALQAALRNKQQLLVLDNFEHVLDAAPFVAELVAACPNICCLITSRERLRLRAEHVLEVPVLALPQTAALSEIEIAPASQLFIARAQQANAQLQLREADAQPIAHLCAKLEGLPLALELLAARADALTPVQLLDDLTRGLNAFENDDGPSLRDLPERHRTLRNAIRWSVRLLSSPQQNLFAHLAVFVGGFDEAAAQAACAHEPTDLQALVRSSLVQKTYEQRYRLLEPIRQYAEEVLAQANAREAAKARHAAHYAALAQESREALLGPEAATWMARLESDHANLQAAIQWSLHSQQPENALRVGQGIWRFWFRRGLWREGLAWLEQALVMDTTREARAPIDIRFSTERAAGVMAQMLSQFERADAHYQAALQWAYALEDDALVAVAYNNLGTLREEQGQFEEALSYFDQSIPYQPEHALKFPWQGKADALLRLGRFDEAKALYEKAMALNQRIGDEEGLAHTLRGLAEVAWRSGDGEAAEKLLRENEVICRKLNHARGLSWTAQQLGNAARVRGDWPLARERYADALTQMRDMGDSAGACEVMAECGHLCVAQSAYAQAARWLGIAQAGWAAIGAKLTAYELGLIEASVSACAQHLEADALQQLLHQGADDWATGQVPEV
jgi:predicted ATPase/DNA-binding XRE family transcriptional regulator